MQGFQALWVELVEDLDGGFVNGPIHAPALPVRPWLIWFHKLTGNTVFLAGLINDVFAQSASAAMT